MKMHNAKEGVFKPVSKTSIGKDSFKKMTDASAYTLSVDTKGELLWDSGIAEISINLYRKPASKHRIPSISGEYVYLMDCCG